MNLPWNEQLSAVRKRLRLDQQAMGRRLGVSREWISKLEKAREVPSDEMKAKLRLLAAEARLHFTEPAFTNDYRVKEPAAVYETGARPGPSTRLDCEVYFQALIEQAAASGNPNAFPVIHDRLQKEFPFLEWTPPKTVGALPLSLPLSAEQLTSMKSKLNAAHTKGVEKLITSSPSHPAP